MRRKQRGEHSLAAALAVGIGHQPLHPRLVRGAHGIGPIIGKAPHDGLLDHPPPGLVLTGLPQ
jgi:hypothetical protein